MQVTAIIPSLNPDEKLAETVDSLLAVGFTDIILVDDGSDDLHRAPFDELEHLPEVTVLRHEINQGKGRAMKTAFSYVLEQRPECVGVVAVDGDGQHGAEDVLHLAQAVQDKPCIWLGARDFSDPAVPPRSRFGNRASCWTMRFLCGMRVRDTQTGLRAFPRDLLPILLEIPGERYEYETKMLLEMKQQNLPFDELTIRTIYLDDNKRSHFNVVRDSWRVYSLMLAHFIRFTGSGLMSAVLDILAFTLLVKLLFPAWFPGASVDLLVLVATVASRLLSSIVNFTINRKLVFHSQRGLLGTLCRYYALSICLMLTSALLVTVFNNWLPGWEPLLKLIADVLLFLFSFRIQQRFVFGRG